MNYLLRYTPRAQEDMDTVWDGVWEASRDYDTADRYVEAFADRIAAKRRFPRSGSPLYYRGLFTGYYTVNYKAYMAFYRVREGCVEVARILPTKRDCVKILFGGDGAEQ